VVIPIVTATGELGRSAELVAGIGNDVLAVPVDHDGPEPDFGADVSRLRTQLTAVSPRRSVAVPANPGDPALPLNDFDFDLPSEPDGVAKPL
jgi:hypothetical protein